MKHPMGKGQFGSVVKATQKGTTSIRAIDNHPEKEGEGSDAVDKRSQHPEERWPIPMWCASTEIFETPEKLYLVMSYCSGKEVFERCMK